MNTDTSAYRSGRFRADRLEQDNPGRRRGREGDRGGDDGRGGGVADTGCRRFEEDTEPVPKVVDPDWVASAVNVCPLYTFLVDWTPG